MGGTKLVLALFAISSCGDVYYIRNEVEPGPGVGGQYFLTMKNTENTCGSALKNYSYNGLVENGKPVEELLDVLFVTPLDAEERELNFKFLEFSINGVTLKDDESFSLHIKGSTTTDVHFNGRFVENRAEMTMDIDVGIPDVAFCKYIFEGVGAKYLDYVIPEVPESAYTK